MRRASTPRRIALAAFFGLVQSGCSAKAPPPPTDHFAGARLVIQLPADSPFEDALALRLTEWRSRTGAATAVVRPQESAEPDLVIGSGAAWSTLASGPGLDDALLSDPALDLKDFAPLFRTALMRDENKIFCVPIAAGGVFLWYRADLFDSETKRAAYKSETGRDLAPPDTWEEYLAVARFFASSGVVPHGCAEAMDESAAATRNFLAHCAPYAKASDWSSFAIDTETGKPRLDAPPFLRGLEDWIAARELSPARRGARLSDEAARAAFLSGQAAMLLSSTPPTFGSTAAGADMRASGSAPLRIDVALLPGSNVVYPPRKGGPTELNVVNRCPHLGDTGWFVGFGKPDPSPAARHLFVFLAGKDASEFIARAARKGALPARTSFLEEPSRFAAHRLGENLTRRFFTLVADGYRAENWVADPRAAGGTELVDSLGKALARILDGQSTPAEGLAAAQREWEQFIARDPETFLNQYRASLGLPMLIR